MNNKDALDAAIQEGNWDVVKGGLLDLALEQLSTGGGIALFAGLIGRLDTIQLALIAREFEQIFSPGQQRKFLIWDKAWRDMKTSWEQNER